MVVATVGVFGKICKDLEKKRERTKNQKRIRDDTDYSLVKIGFNIQKCRGSLRRLDVTQIAIKTISKE